jgi:hypothetical protein
MSTSENRSGAQGSDPAGESAPNESGIGKEGDQSGQHTNLQSAKPVLVTWYIALLIVGLGFGPFMAFVVSPATGEGSGFFFMLMLGLALFGLPAGILLIGPQFGAKGLWHIELPRVLPEGVDERSYVLRASLIRYLKMIAAGVVIFVAMLCFRLVTG